MGGGTPSTQNKIYWGGNIPWITSADIDEYNNITLRKFITNEGIENSTSKIVPKDNIIIASRVGLGKIALNKIDIAINQDLQGLIINKNIISAKFFVFIFSTIISDILDKARGTTIKGITKQELLDLKLPVPNIEDQNQIVSQIESEKKLIEPSKQLIEVFSKKIQDVVNALFK